MTNFNTNAGGWDKNKFIDNKEKDAKYQILINSLEMCDLSGIELSINNASLPWHFGGQSHHNLFVDPDEIEHFCSKTGFKICLDVLLVMACSYYGWNH